MALPDWLFGRTRSFLFGLTLPLKALGVIVSSKRLMALSLLPISLTLILYFFLIARVQDWAKAQLGAYFASLGWGPDAWSTWAVTGLAQIGIFIAAAMTFSVMAAIVASPFNDFLAEQSERHTSPPLAKAPDLPWSGKIRLIGIDLMKSLLAAMAAILALLLSWVPIVNFVAFAISFLLITFQYVSYPQTRRNQGIRDGLGFLWRHSFACLGFGLTMSFLFAIPILSAFCLPLAVVGGTLLFARAPGVQHLQIPQLR